MATNIDKFIEPSETSAFGGVPIGGYVLWQNPDAAGADPTPPTGYEYADGTTVTTGGSTMFGQTKANLMITGAGGAKGFVRGADVSSSCGDGTALVTGGTDTHTHTGSADAVGDHSHTMQSHTHSMQSHTHTVSTDGAHQHETDPPGTFNFEVSAGGGSTEHIVSAGGHDHTGATGAPSTTNTAGPSIANTAGDGGHGHSLTLNAASSTPVFVELAYLIRVL